VVEHSSPKPKKKKKKVVKKKKSKKPELMNIEQNPELDEVIDSDIANI
jgi:hypothetical protein